MRIQLRIVAGTLRGRKLNCEVHPGVRPTPQMVREALFSILGNAVPDRSFFDVFAGTGAIGLEAISRGAAEVAFIERDVRLAGHIDRHLHAFGVADAAQIIRSDAYRWGRNWHPPADPVNVYVSPPFADFTHRAADLVQLLGELQVKLAPGSVLVLQGEKGLLVEHLPDAQQWEERSYGRNLLLLWVKPMTADADPLPDEPALN